MLVRDCDCVSVTVYTTESDSVSSELVFFSLVGRYDNPNPPRLLAPVVCSKIPAQR